MSKDDRFEPTPRLKYAGDVYPVTGQRVFRQDEIGYRAARRTIARTNPKHPVLRDANLWPDLIKEN